jgi:hypothetical protein
MPFRPGDRHEVRADAAAGDHLLGDPVVVEPKVPIRFVEGRIDHRVGDDHVSHAAKTPDPGRFR